jgi:hypothetical protein
LPRPTRGTMLPPLLDVDQIRDRLLVIFPEGTPERAKCTGLAAARTIFTMLYVGAIEGGEWLAPKFVYRMGNSQAAKTSETDRLAYLTAVKKPGTAEPRDRWYKENTRESIRDEALRYGLVAIGAVMVRPDVATTSSKGRYILRGALATLFDPGLTGAEFGRAAGAWRSRHLTRDALARVSILQISATGAKARVPVILPNGEARVMAPGLSSIITKAVVEIFAPRFLKDAAVPWISESGKKVVERDDALVRRLGITIRPEKLPDIILADTGGRDLMFIFVEVVATDGPIHNKRRAELMELVTNAGLNSGQILFLSAFQSRDHPGFKKTVASLAWGTFAWCLSDPDHLIAFDGASPGGIRKIMDLIDVPNSD